MFRATALCMSELDLALCQVFSPPPCLPHRNHITLIPEIWEEQWGFRNFYQKIGGCAFHLWGISYLSYYELLNRGSVHGCCQLWLPAASDSFMTNWVRCLVSMSNCLGFSFVSIKLFSTLKTGCNSHMLSKIPPPKTSPLPPSAFLPFSSSLLGSMWIGNAS